MKIGFLGNTNNYPFRLARALKSLGHDVLFFVDRPKTELRNRPEFHYHDIPYPYPPWIREIKPIAPIDVLLRTRVVRAALRELESCDGVVLNGTGLSLGTAISCPHIGLLTGSDLDVYANKNLVKRLASAPSRFDSRSKNIFLNRFLIFVKRLLFARYVKLQRLGIAKCRLVEYAIPGLLPHGDSLLEEIGISRDRRASFMMSDIEHVPASPKRHDNAFQVLCAMRLQWKRPEVGSNVSPLDFKGTDVMLAGLRDFAKRTRRNLIIHMIRIGSDLAEAERRIFYFGLARYVHWHDELTQMQFLVEMRNADVVLENFGMDSCLGMAGRDAIAMGKPVIAWGNSKIFENVLGEPLPIYEAISPDQICAYLEEIAENAEAVAERSAETRAYAERWFSAVRAAKFCVEVLSSDA